MDFYKALARTLNSGKSRSVILWGNIHDLFYSEKDEKYVSLVDFLLQRTATPSLLQVVYELNGPIRMSKEVRRRIKQFWGNSYVGKNSNETIEQKLLESVGRPAFALELLRQMTMASRANNGNLLIIVEAADMMIPTTSNLTNLSGSDRRCVCIAKDWFSDSNFVMGKDSVVLLAESVSEIYQGVTNLPQVAQIEIPSPAKEERAEYIEKSYKDKGVIDDLANKTAGLTLQAIRQILVTGVDDVYSHVERFIKAQVGEDTIEFKRPTHTLKDIVGNSNLKEFLIKELIPRFRSTGIDALPGAAVCGPIGSGKTFIFEAVAGEIGCPVIILKNLRSQYFGQTDVIFERLRRVLESIEKILIFVDEADTQFGRVDRNAHATERRLTGKIQAMMSDPKLKGKVLWLLMTARIHLLSPDIRRPGRVGDLIIPVFDPEGEDIVEFAKWSTSNLDLSEDETVKLCELVGQSSAAFWASIRSAIIANNATNFDEISDVIKDMIPSNIEEEREYQKLQALINCTRRSLLPLKERSYSTHNLKSSLNESIKKLEEKGIG